MQLCFFVSVILLLFVCYGFCKPDMHVGHQVTVAVPLEYSVGLIGRAFVMETNQMEPNFRVALSVEAVNGRYSCSLEVFLGDVKVWNSGHYSRFYVSDKCVLELSEDGDLRLMGLRNRVGWRTGTSGQGVEVNKSATSVCCFVSVKAYSATYITCISLIFLLFDAEATDSGHRQFGSG